MIEIASGHRNISNQHERILVADHDRKFEPSFSAACRLYSEQMDRVFFVPSHPAFGQRTHLLSGGWPSGVFQTVFDQK